jgi:hypothetical protein
MIRKLLTNLVVLVLGFVFTTTLASAQTQIGLVGTSCNACLNFVTTGTGLSETMTGPAATGVAITMGTPFIPMVSLFSLSQTSAILLTASGTAGLYSAAPGSGGFDISLSGPGGLILTGFLSILNFSANTNSGTFDTTVAGNFDITGGSFCSSDPSACGPGAGYGKIVLTLVGPIEAGGTAGLDGGKITIPAENSSVTPEPASMVLFGIGLLALGATLRRRKIATA